MIAPVVAGVLLVLAGSGCGSKKRTAYEDAGVAGSAGSAGSAAGSASVQVAGAFDAKCLAGDREACRNLGVMYTEGLGVAKDPRRAAALFAQACNGGSLAGCNHLALVLAEGLGVPADPAEAVKLYRRACDGGYGLACRNLGLALRGGRGVEHDLPAAAVAFEKACATGTPFGCTNAGDLDRALAEAAAPKERAPHFKQMVDHYRRGCDAAEAAACRNIGIAYLEGIGLPKSASAASVWLERACTGKQDRKTAIAGDVVGCRVLGMMKLQGVGVAQDVAAGTQALKLACDRKDAEACQALAPNTAGSASGSGATKPATATVDAGVASPADAR